VDKVLFIRSSAFRTTRVIRQANALAESGFSISVLHWERMMDTEHNNKVISSLDYSDTVIPFERKCEYGRGILSAYDRLLWFWFVFKTVLKEKPQIVHAVDFDSAFPAYFACVIKKINIVYDIADYIETFDSNIPNVIRKIVRFISERIVKYSKVIILPDQNRLINIEKKYHNKVVIVNNAPAIDINKLPLDSNIVDTRRTNVFYYGAFSEDRAIRHILAASKDTRLCNVTFWFAGWGALEKLVCDSQSHNVRFVGKLTQPLALSLLRKMDCSIICYDPKFEHNRLASPNKIFEAMACGIPVLVCKDTSIDILVEQEKLGYVCEYNSSSLADTILSMTDKNNQLYSHNMSNVYPQFNWESSKNNLVELYEKISR
jgi:glycosyltransferase involved in cell wall biosynthesis